MSADQRPSAEKDALAERIRSEASIADRPGQLVRLEAIADEVEALVRDRDYWHDVAVVADPGCDE